MLYAADFVVSAALFFKAYGKAQYAKHSTEIRRVKPKILSPLSSVWNLEW